MKAATHDGTCQLCGSSQKLPDGRLSLHGYTKQWGYFTGQCPGSRHLPYEVSCDLLPPRLASTKESIADLEAQIERLLKPAQSTKAWVKITTRMGRTRTTRWAEADLYKECNRVWFNDNEGERREFAPSDYRVDFGKMSLVEIATYANSKRAEELGFSLRQLAQYADWCDNRIKTWEKRPLVETAPPKPPSIPMAYLYVEVGQERGIHPDPIPASLDDAAIIELATKALQSGSLSGMASQPDADLSSFEVSRLYGFMGRIKTRVTVRRRKARISS